MRPVQLILIAMILGVLFLYFNRLRSGIADRIAVLLVAGAGIIMATAPDLTTRIAALVGVGRGADLFFYLALVGFGFFGLVLYSKLRDTDARITELARAVAIQTAHRPGDRRDDHEDNPS